MDYRISKLEYPINPHINYPNLKSGYIIECRADMMGGFQRSFEFDVYDTIQEAKRAFKRKMMYQKHANSKTITPIEDLKWE